MPPKKTGVLSDNEEEEQGHIILHELVNTDKLSHIYELKLDPEVELAVATLHDAFFDKIHLSSYKRTVYRPSPDFPMGRMYGDGLQNMPACIKRILTENILVESDIVSCAPTILKHVMDTRVEWCPPLLARYVDNRRAFFDDMGCQIVACGGVLLCVLDMKKIVKKIFLAVLHGANYKT
jgi:hypothetical protein